jgi:GNAT superfamily N-acetyltransferase
MITLRRLVPADQPQLRRLWVERWGGETIVAHGTIHSADGLDGLIAIDRDKWIGLITFLISGQECEIVSLDSLCERRGIGTALVNAVISEAQQARCRRVWLVTTNDNLNALGFYQKRGFELVAVHRHAMAEVRQHKPQIPETGLGGIPLRDEIELELLLDATSTYNVP